MYSTPQPETQLIHNLEHGGIVIWYDPEALTAESIDALTAYVQNQNASGVSGRYKFILSPWGGSEPLAGPGRGDGLAMDPRARDGRHRRDRRVRAGELPRHAPEPNGGPGPPG